jgi:hypothetical protein
MEVMKLLKSIWNNIRFKTQQEREHEWLAQSKDLVDLERRQRILQNNMNRRVF